MKTVVNHRELTLQDRCDSCGAAAKVIATFVTGELLFCGHHARESGAKLVKTAVELFDPESVVSPLS